MDNKIYVMGCIVDNAAFTSASTALIHYKGKKHRARVAVYIRHPMNEKLGVRIRDASKIPMVQILNYMSTLGSVQTVHLEDSFGINETFFQSAVIFYDSEDTVTSIRQSRHFVSGTQLVLSKYLINDDPLRPDTPPPPCKVEYLNDKEIDEQVRNLVKEHKDIDEQLDFMVQAIQLKPHELGVRRDICREIEDHFRMHLNQYAEVFAFGSSYTSFGFQGCTLDIHMSIKQGFPQRQEEETYEAWRQRCREREKMCVLNAGKLLRDHSQNKVSQVSLSLNSRVPVVKFMHKETGIKCEMGFKNRIAVAVSEFIRCCNNYDKRIKPLCLGIKYWATRYCLSGGPDVLSREVILSK